MGLRMTENGGRMTDYRWRKTDNGYGNVTRIFRPATDFEALQRLTDEDKGKKKREYRG